MGCRSLTDLVLPDTVTEIGEYAFALSGLQTMRIPSSVTEIKGGTFVNCSSLTTVELSGNLTTIGRLAFGNTALTTVELPESLTTIGQGAFGNAPLTQITIPEHVTEIGADAFKMCTSLNQVILKPQTVPTMEGPIFSDCDLEWENFVVPAGMEDVYRKALGLDGNGNNPGGNGSSGGNSSGSGNKNGSNVGNINGTDSNNFYEEADISQEMLAGLPVANDLTGLPNNSGIMPGNALPVNVSNDNQKNTDNNVTNRSGSSAGKSNTREPRTEDTTPLELYATLAMIAGTVYLLLYFTERKHGMTQERKQELVSELIGWAKQGGRFRKLLALTAIFFILLYYHSIGRPVDMEWRFE